jgi:predicted acetyltransferase
MDLTVRPVDDGEFDRWFATENAVFGSAAFSAERAALERSVLPLDRTVAAFDGDTLVGTAGSFPFDMTVPGGATLPIAGVTAVTTVPTHRRQGVLRAMMAFQLDDVAARDEPMAVLNASESSIYDRFGYGIAQLYQEYEVDTLASAFRQPVAERSAPLRWLSRDDAARELPAIYDECRLRRPGMFSHSGAWWGCVLGDPVTWKGGGEDLYVVVADADEQHGTGPGYAIYRLQSKMSGGNWTLRVLDLEATDPVVEAQLWRFLLDVDLVRTFEAERRPLDCTLRWLFAQPRKVRVSHIGDYLWIRLLDIERSLSAREYRTDGELVLAVTDPFRPANDGTYLLRGDKSLCERTDGDADLELDVGELGAIYLGQTRPSALAAAGRVVERTPGAVARADDLFAWPVAPNCVTRF